jgi:hypothetical protein
LALDVAGFLQSLEKRNGGWTERLRRSEVIIAVRSDRG